jgi:hypothetical protein
MAKNNQIWVTWGGGEEHTVLYRIRGKKLKYIKRRKVNNMYTDQQTMLQE